VPQISSAYTSPALSALAEHPAHRSCAYERHRPEETVLYRVLQAHWKSFLADMESAAELAALPAFVVSEVEAFLKCGILAQGLVLAKCRDCAREGGVYGGSGRNAPISARDLMRGHRRPQRRSERIPA
jgi:hypothetical protein